MIKFGAINIDTSHPKSFSQYFETVEERGKYVAVYNDGFRGDDELLSFAEKRGLKICKTKQGYHACTTLALTKNSAITADEGIKKALTAEGIDVTLIENGDISLPPYEYGFIGGASFFDNNTLFTFGDVKKHKNGNDRIISVFVCFI